MKIIQVYSDLLYRIRLDKKSQPRKNNSVDPLYLIIEQINGCNEESKGNKFLTLVPTDESKDTLKHMKN